jgi:hypothetical protein
MFMGCDLRREFMLRDERHGAAKGNSRKDQNSIPTLLFILACDKYNFSLCVQHFQETSDHPDCSPD